MSNTRKLTFTAMMGALAYLLMFFAFPILPSAMFLKIDFSDIPLLITTIVYGPLAGTSASLIRSVLHYIQTGGDLGFPIGDFASFVASLAYILPIAHFIKKGGSKKDLLIGSVIGILSLTLVMSFLNAVVLMPFYSQVMGLNMGPLMPYVLLTVIPFNLLKGIIVTLVVLILVPQLLKMKDLNVTLR